jgi:N-acyl-D-aspartate/D-glutamate deacylase
VTAPHVDLAVRGGTVVDGTGRRGFRADVGISDGHVARIDARVQGTDEIDATGRLVVPGFVDVHTHYDAQALWDPELSPSGSQGVTSVIAGNCGFSVAPARDTGRDLLLRTLETVEDMRLATMHAGIEWDFETYPDYLRAVARRRPTINFGGYVGHTAVRVYVMGADASERHATDAELDAMRAVVADALRGGALGFSTDRAGFIAGADGRPVPSIVASQHEVEALMRVTAEVGRGIVHIAPGDDYAWLYDFQPTLGRVVNWSAVLAYPEGSTTRASHRQKLADHAAGRRRGADVWAQVTCRPITQLVTLREPAPFSSVPAFGEVLAAPPDRRPDLYADPAWRARAQRDLAASSIPLRWDAFTVAETVAHPELIGQSVAAIAERGSRDPFATMCELAIDDQLSTRFSVTFANDDPAAIHELLLGDGCILGLSDAGAHVSQICDATMPLDFLAHWVRDRDVMPLAQGIRKLSGELADVLGLDRGYVRVGQPADLVVLDYERLDPGPVRRVRDMPADGERLVADAPAGVDAMIVNGVPIRRDGASVALTEEQRPGQILRS